MHRWVKFVAIFMLAFAFFDVCTPEPCEAHVLAPEQSQTQFQVQHDGGNGESCQFEEDCFSCGHFTPGTSFVLSPIAVVSFTDPPLFVPPLDGTPLIPYHPPRA